MSTLEYMKNLLVPGENIFYGPFLNRRALKNNQENVQTCNIAVEVSKKTATNYTPVREENAIPIDGPIVVLKDFKKNLPDKSLNYEKNSELPQNNVQEEKRKDVPVRKQSTKTNEKLTYTNKNKGEKVGKKITVKNVPVAKGSQNVRKNEIQEDVSSCSPKSEKRTLNDKKRKRNPGQYEVNEIGISKKTISELQVYPVQNIEIKSVTPAENICSSTSRTLRQLNRKNYTEERVLISKRKRYMKRCQNENSTFQTNGTFQDVTQGSVGDKIKPTHHEVSKKTATNYTPVREENAIPIDGPIVVLKDFKKNLPDKSLNYEKNSELPQNNVQEEKRKDVPVRKQSTKTNEKLTYTNKNKGEKVGKKITVKNVPVAKGSQNVRKNEIQEDVSSCSPKSEKRTLNDKKRKRNPGQYEVNEIGISKKTISELQVYPVQNIEIKSVTPAENICSSTSRTLRQLNRKNYTEERVLISKRKRYMKRCQNENSTFQTNGTFQDVTQGSVGDKIKPTHHGQRQCVEEEEPKACNSKVTKILKSEKLAMPIVLKKRRPHKSRNEEACNFS